MRPSALTRITAWGFEPPYGKRIVCLCALWAEASLDSPGQPSSGLVQETQQGREEISSGMLSNAFQCRQVNGNGKFIGMETNKTVGRIIGLETWEEVPWLREY